MADAEGIVREVKRHLEKHADCEREWADVDALDSALALMAVDREFIEAAYKFGKWRFGLQTPFNGEVTHEFANAFEARRARLAAQSHAPGPAEQHEEERS